MEMVNNDEYVIAIRVLGVFWDRILVGAPAGALDCDDQDEDEEDDHDEDNYTEGDHIHLIRLLFKAIY